MLYALTAVCIRLAGRSIDNHISNDGYVQEYNPGPTTIALSVDLSVSISVSLSLCVFLTLSGSVITLTLSLFHTLYLTPLSLSNISVHPSSILLSTVLHLVYCARLVTRVPTHTSHPLHDLNSLCSLVDSFSLNASGVCMCSV